MLAKILESPPVQHQAITNSMLQTTRQRTNLILKLLPRGDHHLSGRGRSGCAQVSDKIRNREVCLVPNCGNDRNLRSEYRARESLIVECSQIFERAASARDHDDVHFARFVEIANTGDHFGGCSL